MNHRSCVRVFAFLLVCLSPGSSVSAQGVTSAAVTGQVTDEAGAVVAGATLTLTNAATGQRYTARAASDGRYFFENVQVGGPYALQARALGFEPVTVTDLMLTLSERLVRDFALKRAAVEVAGVTIVGTTDPLRSSSRTGATTFVSDTAIARLPTLNRNFTDFITTVPQVEGTSIAGQHNRMNNIQIDGAHNNDLFGLGASGQPGGQVDAKSITLEAVREYQVLIAPFDVRQSGFSGGLVNAITKRGTNQWRGSVFEYWQSDRLVGSDTGGTRFGEYTQNQYGFTLGGPISPNRLHFFGAAEWQGRSVPIGGVTIGRESPSAVGIATDSARRLVEILENSYDQSAGEFGEVPVEAPNRNLFGRLDFQINDRHTLTLRHNHVKASQDDLSHSQSFYRLTSHAFAIDNTTNSTVAQLNSTLGGGRFYNELTVGLQTIRDRRNPVVRYPELEVRNTSNVGGTNLNATFLVGAERFSQANELDQDVFEITNNLTFGRGSHRVTVGTHNEWISFRNLFFPNSTGSWRFGSLDSLAQGLANRFTRTIPYSDAAAGRPGSLVAGVPVADWAVTQLGAYVQDQWDVRDNLTITAGFRFDVPILGDAPVYSGAADSAFGIRTDNVPSGNILWSPRIGFNWDVTGDRRTVVRGGAGVFSGRPAYVWLSNAYTNTGRETLNLTCTRTATTNNVPAFTLDADNQPSACSPPGGVAIPTAVVNYFEDSFHFPQQFKLSAAVDRELPLGLLGTLEFLYTRSVYSIQLQEKNLQGVQSTARDGRPMYGTIVGTTVTPARRNAAFGQVLAHTNGDQDRAFSLTAQVQKRFDGRYEVSAAYTFQDVKDIMSLGSSIATSNFGFNPISGDPSDPPLERSAFHIPHKVVLSGTINLPRSSAFTLIYTGNSGRPYTWTYDGDVNADGYPAANISGRNNDIIYVPDANPATDDFRGTTAQDFGRLDSLINMEECLSKARGRILPRNSCQNPWRNRLDAKFTHSVQAYGDHDLTLVVDAFNVLNLLNKDWGVVKNLAFNETASLLRMTGFDAATNQGIFQYIGPTPGLQGQINNLASRWRLQVGLRYDF